MSTTAWLLWCWTSFCSGGALATWLAYRQHKKSTDRLVEICKLQMTACKQEMVQIVEGFRTGETHYTRLMTNEEMEYLFNDGKGLEYDFDKGK